MASDASWPRWIFASVAHYFSELAGDNGLPLLIEHAADRQDSFSKAGIRVELRSTGPSIRELSRDYFHARVDVNLLFTSRYDADAYEILRFAGIFQEAMSVPIPLWNYGNQPGDYTDADPESQVHLGCLLLVDGRNDSLRLLNFGQIEPVDKVKQTMLDGRYEVYFST